MMNTNTRVMIHPSLLLFSAWILIIFADERLGDKLFLSNFIALGLGAYAITTVIMKKFNESRMLLTALAFILLATLCSHLFFGTQTHAAEELTKSVLVVIGGVAIGKLFSTEELEFILKPFPIVLAGYLFIQFFIIGAPDSLYRLALDRSLGCANTLAYLMGFAVILLLYVSCQRKLASRSHLLDASFRWHDKELYAPHLFSWGLIIFFCILIAETYSRSGTLGLIAGILYMLLFRKNNPLRIRDLLALLVPIFILLSLWVMDHFSHYLHLTHFPTLVPQTHETYPGGINRFNIHEAHSGGRIEMWTIIIQEIISHPKAWLTGFGPGFIQHLNFINAHYLSADSFIIKFFYSYGLIGLIISCSFCLGLLWHHPTTVKYNSIKKTLSVFMVFTLITNDTASASQAILVSMLLVGFIFSREEAYRVKLGRSPTRALGDDVHDKY